MAWTFVTLRKCLKNYLDSDDLYCNQPPGGDQDLLTSSLFTLNEWVTRGEDAKQTSNHQGLLVVFLSSQLVNLVTSCFNEQPVFLPHVPVKFFPTFYLNVACVFKLCSPTSCARSSCYLVTAFQQNSHVCSVSRSQPVKDRSLRLLCLPTSAPTFTAIRYPGPLPCIHVCFGVKSELETKQNQMGAKKGDILGQ